VSRLDYLMIFIKGTEVVKFWGWRSLAILLLRQPNPHDVAATANGLALRGDFYFLTTRMVMASCNK